MGAKPPEGHSWPNVGEPWIAKEGKPPLQLEGDPPLRPPWHVWANVSDCTVDTDFLSGKKVMTDG